MHLSKLPQNCRSKIGINQATNVRQPTYLIPFTEAVNLGEARKLELNRKPTVVGENGDLHVWVSDPANYTHEEILDKNRPLRLSERNLPVIFILSGVNRAGTLFAAMPDGKRKIPAVYFLHNRSIEIMPINKDSNATAYWKENLRYLTILLTIWFAVSYGAGILFKGTLDNFRLGGFKLGFLFAQQGSIYVFVVLIFVYVRLMNKLDKKYGYDEE